MGEINLTEIAIMIIVLGLVVSIGAVILINYQDSVTVTTSESASETFLGDNASTQTLTQTPTNTVTATAKNNSWLSFDGVNDNINLGNPSYLLVEQKNYSICAWVNFSDELIGGIVSHGDASGSGSTVKQRFMLGITENNLTVSFGEDVGDALGSMGNCSIINGTINVFDGKFHSVCTSFGAPTSTTGFVNLYYDGVLSGSNNTLCDGDGFGGFDMDDGGVDYAWFIASEDFSENFLNSSINELRIYNRTITQAEVTEIFNSGLVANFSLNSTSLQLWLPINENSGTDMHSFNQSDLT